MSLLRTYVPNLVSHHPTLTETSDRGNQIIHLPEPFTGVENLHPDRQTTSTIHLIGASLPDHCMELSRRFHQLPPLQ